MSPGAPVRERAPGDAGDAGDDHASRAEASTRERLGAAAAPASPSGSSARTDGERRHSATPTPADDAARARRGQEVVLTAADGVELRGTFFAAVETRGPGADHGAASGLASGLASGSASGPASGTASGGDRATDVTALPPPSGRPAVLFGCATGVSQRYYAGFAAYLADRGFDALTLDYRGIGRSRSGSPRQSRATFADWGELDLDAGLAWLQARRPSALLLVGHSVAGQILPLASRAPALDAAFFIGSQSGYWRNWDGWRRWAIFLCWFLGPILPVVLGSLPSVFMGGGEALPGSAARQWARWGRQRDYVLSYRPDVRGRFAALGARLLFVSADDDRFYGPRRSVDILASWYQGARLERRHWVPRDFGLSSIGHFGFFRSSMRESLWPMVGDWLEGAAHEAAVRHGLDS